MTLLRGDRNLATRHPKTDDLAGIVTATCTADTDSGGPCGRDSVPGAPFPVCPDHLLSAYRFVANVMDDGRHRSRITLGLVGDGVSSGKLRNLRVVNVDAHVMNGWDSLVYYINVGEHIKIGHSTRMANRILSYPPSARVLALEPGFYAMERRRQRQFASLRAARVEWFHPGQELLDHIAALADRGLPPGPLVTGVPAPAELTS